MGARILVAMDDSEMAEEALRYALETHTDAEVTVLHVVGGPSPMGGQATGLALADDIDEAAEDLAADVFATAREIAGEYDREIQTTVKVGHPARVIVKHAEGYDSVVIGTHGGSVVQRLLVGNVAEKVFRGSPVPVTVVR
jgi:nucleotide-binding universal stress UspA family protein